MAANSCPPFSREVEKEVQLAGHKLIFAPEGAVFYPEAAQLAYRRICEGL
jgi:hypothetical protein